MREMNLPENYKGYSTKELLDLWRSIPSRTLVSPQVPGEMVLVMHDLLDEYKLAPNNWGYPEETRTKNTFQSKKLLAPFGIDPAPWIDPEGNRIPKDKTLAL